MSGIQSCVVVIFILFEILDKCVGEYCVGYDHVCHYPHRCCANTCCVPQGYNDYYSGFRWSIWNMWYFWFIVIFILTSCFGGCGYWRRRQLMLGHGGASRDMFGMFNFYGRWGSSRPASCSRNGEVLSHPGLCSRSAGHRVPMYSAAAMNSAASRVRATSAEPTNFPSPPAYAEVVSKPYGEYEDLPPYSSREDIRLTTGDEMAPVHMMSMSMPPPYSPPEINSWATTAPCPPYTESAATSQTPAARMTTPPRDTTPAVDISTTGRHGDSSGL